jgi:hypothetical protein
MGIGDRVRRWVRLACVIAVGIVLAAPLLLGPALAPMARALGGDPQHLCACGMEEGKCGCPECERMAQAAHDDDMADAIPSPRPVLKSGCDDDTRVVPSFAAFTVATLPAGETLPPPHAMASTDTLAPDTLLPRGRKRPPTPPPRSTRG